MKFTVNCALLSIFAAIVSGEFPACRITKTSASEEYCTADSCPESRSEFNRIIALGDIHGSYSGMLEDLFVANITSASDKCEWATQNGPTLFVQIGDIVDRGGGALETWKCLRKLQSEASAVNSKVVRLLGNHELWWLEGYLHHRHKTADTKEKIIELVQYMAEDILDGSVVSAFVHRIRSVPLLFTHAGINPGFHKYLKNKEKVADDVDAIAAYVNNQLVSATSSCSQLPCSYEGEVFDSGPERGGKGIGGPFWTDFSTLEKGAQEHPNHDFIQVVGHTMAWCYHPSRLGIHPPKDQFECALGLIRPSQDLQSVCIDGGMYAGARAFLEIDQAGHFIAHEMIEVVQGQSLFSAGVKSLKWTVRDLSQELMCEDYV